jgi:hypothetical protein
MSDPTQRQYLTVLNAYLDIAAQNRDIKTSLAEKDEICTRLRRELNTTRNTVDRLQQIVSPGMFLAAK